MPTPHNSRVVFAAGALFALSLSGCDNIKIRREPIPNAQDGTQPDPSNAQDPNTDPPQPLKPSAQVRTQSLCEKSCEREGLRACEGIRFVQPEDNCVEHCVPSLGDTFQDIQDETCVDALLSLFECSTDQECVEASKLLSALDKRNKFSFTDLGACTMELAIAMQSCHSQAPDQDQEPGKDKEPPQPQPEPDPDPDPEPAVAQFFDQRWTQMHALAGQPATTM